MNKYQKAFNLLTGKETIPCYECKTYHCEDCEHFKESSRVLSELVDKATPMKPISDYEYEDYWDDGYWEIYKREFYACPMCKKELLDNWKGCPHCLQALDWSDVK